MSLKLEKSTTVQMVRDTLKISLVLLAWCAFDEGSSMGHMMKGGMMDAGGR